MEDFEKNEDFMEFLEEYMPGWELEYTGNVAAMYDAWCAAIKLVEERESL
jgi:hypothetical protein